MSIAQQSITASEFEQLSFERPTELIRGEIVECEMPTTRHGSVCLAIGALLWIWSRSTKLGTTFSNDSHVLTERDPDTVRGPDCAFIRYDRLPGGKLPTGVLTIPVDLAIEVLSPSDRWTEVMEKVLEYLKSGVSEVWVVDPDKRTVAIHRADQTPVYLTESDTLTRPELLPGFSCQVAEFFADL